MEPDGLTIVLESGRYQVDRTSFECTGCNFILDMGDPYLYMTKRSIPASLGGKCCTIYSRRVVKHYSDLRRFTPGISDGSLAETLTYATNEQDPRRTNKDVVRPESVADALLIFDACASALDRSMQRPRVAELGVYKAVSVDGGAKFRQNKPEPKLVDGTAVEHHYDGAEFAEVISDE